MLRKFRDVSRPDRGFREDAKFKWILHEELGSPVAAVLLVFLFVYPLVEKSPSLARILQNLLKNGLLARLLQIILILEKILQVNTFLARYLQNFPRFCKNNALFCKILQGCWKICKNLARNVFSSTRVIFGHVRIGSTILLTKTFCNL